MKSHLLSLFAAFIAVLLYSNTVSAETATDKISIEDFWVVKGEQVAIGLQVTNASLYTAFQCDLFLPEGLALTKNEQGEPIMNLCGNNAQSHIIESNTLANGGIRIVVMSMSNVAFTPEDAIAQITIDVSSDAVGQKIIKTENARLVSVGDRTELDVSDTQSTANVVEQRTTITAKNSTREYGNANPVFEYTIEGPALDGEPEVICEANATSPVGDYDIVIKQGSIKNTCLIFVNATLTITKAPLAVMAGTYTKKQGEENPEFTLTYEGFKNDETEDVLITKPTATTTATKESTPGEYVVTVSGGDAKNYELSYTNGKLIVTDADAVIVKAKSYSREYGDDNPAFEYEVSGTELDGMPEITCEATASSPVGTYPIVVKKGSVTNYNVTYVEGTLTITKAPLTVKVEDVTREQYLENPEFVITYSGWKVSDDESVLTKKPTVTTEATKDSPIGEYAIVVSGGEARNYELNYQNGVLTIIESTGIAEISVISPADVYTLQGHKVRTKVTTLEGLPKGVYVINGKKVVVK